MAHKNVGSTKGLPEPLSVAELHELRTSEATFRAIVSIASDAIISTDSNLHILHFNSGAEEIFGYSASEVVGRPLTLLMPERYHARHDDHMRSFGRGEIQARRMGERAEISGRRKDGSEFPAEASISRVEVDGQIIFTAVLRDVTEQRRSESVLRFLAEAGAMLTSSLDVQNTLANVARLAVPMLGDWCVIFLGSDSNSIRRVHAVHSRPGHEAEMARLIEIPFRMHDAHPVSQAIDSGRALFVNAITHERYEAMADSPEHLDLLERLHASSMLVVPLRARDATLGAITFHTETDGNRHYTDDDLLLAEELGRRAALALDNASLYSEAKAAVQTRDDLLAVVSHDLGNPLSAIRLGTSLLLKRVPQNEVESGPWRHLDNIRAAVAQMERLIRDLLDIKRIEAGVFSLELQRISVNDLVRDAHESFKGLVEGKEIEFRVQMTQTPAFVLADRERIHQLFSNLIGNAVKFTNEGGRIDLAVELAGSEAVFCVSDNGQGIAAEEARHVFDRFWQSRRSGKQGIGLGLAIVKGISDAHRGRVWLETRPGGGTSFRLALPLVEIREDQ